MSLIIEKLDGTSYNLTDLGIRVREFRIESPEVINTIKELDRGRLIITDSKYGLRRLYADLRFVGRDLDDYFSLMSEVFQLLNGLEEFYLINEKEPLKRWKVRTDGKYTPERTLFYGDFEITFICAEKYSLSVNKVNEKFTTPNFIFKNEGDVLIDPREQEIEITFKGSSINLGIKNETTGDEWSYTGTTTANDEIKLIGVRALKNGLSIFRDTNRKLLTLTPGKNQISITGTSGKFELIIRTRFYFL